MAEAPTPLLVYDRIDANRRRTLALLVCFGLLLVPFVAGFVPFLIPVLTLGVLLPVLGAARFDQLLREAPGAYSALVATFALATAVVGTVLTVAVNLRYSARLVLRMAGARPIRGDEAPELRRIVEGLSLAAGLPQPRLHLIESPSPNAFAVGLDPRSAAIAVTRGLLDLLDRRELEGVVAHELSRIGNQDVRLGTVLAAAVTTLRIPLRLLFRLPRPIAVGVLGLSFVGVLLMVASVIGVLAELALVLWVIWEAPSESALRLELRGFLGSWRELAIVAFFFVYAWLFVAAPAYVLVGAQALGRLVRGTVSRQRELLADADAVLLTRDPEGLALALIKMDAAGGGPVAVTAAAAHLYIVEPMRQRSAWWDRGFGSRPPIAERVDLLARMGTGIARAALSRAYEAGERVRVSRARTAVAAPGARSPGAGEEPPPGSIRSPAPSGDPRPADPEPAFGVPGVVSYLQLAATTSLLEAPDKGSRALASLGAGAVVRLLGTDGEFLRVQPEGGATGYVPRSTPVTWPQ